MIIGVVLVVVGVVVSYFGGGFGVLLMKFGVVMMFGGVIQMLLLQLIGLFVCDLLENGVFYNFNGFVNISVQGNFVLLLYGEFEVGLVVIFGGIFVEDQVQSL